MDTDTECGMFGNNLKLILDEQMEVVAVEELPDAFELWTDHGEAGA